MRANEFLTEERLDEVDWSKLKKAIAVGAISLASLGLPGISQADVQGMTDQQFIDHWHKWYPSQSDAEIMRALNNQKDLEKWSRDSRDEIDAEYKKSIEKNKADSDARMAKIKADAAEHEKQVKNQKQQEFEKNSPPTPEAQLSKFSIKGLRFGMSLSQVANITKATQWDRMSYSSAQPRLSDYQNNDAGYFAALKKHNQDLVDQNKIYTKPIDNWLDAMNNFTIGGLVWNAYPEDYTKMGSSEGKLGMLVSSIDPEQFEGEVKKFSAQFGRPNIEKSSIITKLGLRATNVIARWQIRDGFITIKKYDGKITEGSIVIDSTLTRKSLQQKQQQDSVRNSKDF
jgi:hypothetical protein